MSDQICTNNRISVRKPLNNHKNVPIYLIN
nr:MAG TPA: hypothetical protein [Caudoviricetes sp.]